MEQQIKETRRILVIEDEPVIGHVCQKVLARQGFAVDVVTDGKKAMKSMRNRHYDLFILDLRLPGMDGIQLYKYLADNSPELSQNIIFTTGDIASNQISQFLNSFKKVYLEKPFTPQELVTAVKMALN
jgi:DNA-binding response OmpR family regulator